MDKIIILTEGNDFRVSHLDNTLNSFVIIANRDFKIKQNDEKVIKTGIYLDIPKKIDARIDNFYSMNYTSLFIVPMYIYPKRMTNLELKIIQLEDSRKAIKIKKGQPLAVINLFENKKIEIKESE